MNLEFAKMLILVVLPTALTLAEFDMVLQDKGKPKTQRKRIAALILFILWAVVGLAYEFYVYYRG